MIKLVAVSCVEDQSAWTEETITIVLQKSEKEAVAKRDSFSRERLGTGILGKRASLCKGPEAEKRGI